MQSETHSVCPHYAISTPSVRHQYASPVEVRLVHAHRDGRQLPGRRRKPIVTVGEPASSDCAEAGKLQMTLLCKGEHAILRPQVDERVLDLDEWQSVTIRGHRWPAVAISGHQCPSVAISGYQRHSEALSGTNWPSVPISGHQRPSEGTQRALSDTQWHAVALGGTLRHSAALNCDPWRVLDLVRRERQALVHHELAQVRRVEVACGRLTEEPFALEGE